ncbi:hypothetical protein BGZ74_008414 [Mortierella antarctica]|nr:hypothetical protein BGZ74_008414 [Mortierella antarctica]
MPITVIALSTLALASQAIAQLIHYSSPIATTIWTAGQPAMVSWTNSCNEVVGNTTFPIYIQGPPVGMIPDAIGYLDCKMPGKSNVMVPATLPQGNEINYHNLVHLNLAYHERYFDHNRSSQSYWF